MSNRKNLELTERFDKVYPCAHSNLRGLVFPWPHKTFIVRAKGSRMWDVDGNEYIDYLLAHGPNILGHQHPEYVRALKDYLDTKSPIVGAGTYVSPDDVELGETLVRHIPCAEQIKFSISGTDAVQFAIRLARAHTKRPRFIRFSSQYHGNADNTLGGLVNNDPDGRPFAIDVRKGNYGYTEGKSPGANEESFLLPYNDIERLEETLEKYAEEVALIHFEPMITNHYCLMPRPGYVERIRELCDKYGIVLSFDEVITGFRLALGGVQEYFGWTPDIATYGKAIAGGLPLSAVAGKSEILDLFRENRVLGPGTFNAFPMGTTGALATIKILQKDDGAVYKHIDQMTRRLMQGMREIAKRRGLKVRVQGETGVFTTVFGADPDTVIYSDADVDRQGMKQAYDFGSQLHEAGISIQWGRWFVCAVITDDDVAQTLDTVDKVMGKI